MIIMLALNFRHIYKVCDKVIIRSLRGKIGPTGPAVGPNPGLNSRIKEFRKAGVKIEDDDVEEFVNQSESNFLSTGEAYNEHLTETLMGKHILRHQIVKEKYFKENMPNLLTWSEKEQIRLLNSEHPDEWTPERIAESFPVTEAVVKKLLKFPWKPTSENRIARHDASALRNWKQLKEGTLDIPEDIRQHFLKFSDRTIPPLDNKSIKIDLTQAKEMGEFQKIIEKCANKENTEQYDVPRLEGSEESLNDGNDEKKQMKWKVYKRVTLDDLTNKIKTRLEKGKNVELPDKMLVKAVENVSTLTHKVDHKTQFELENTDETAIAHFKEDAKSVPDLKIYPERIRIPKKAYKRGATYKVEDVYYDDDGRFLYRVIGMTK